MPSLVRDYFNWLASMYDETTAACEWSAPEHIAKAALPFVHTGQLVLDLGCGTGQSSAPFLPTAAAASGSISRRRCWPRRGANIPTSA